MSISFKSSFDTIVVEKARDDPLQFLSDPSRVRKDLDLKGLSDSARKSFSALKPWQHAAAWYVTTYVLCYALSQACHLLLLVSITLPLR
jgi:hypothetical protein